MSRRKPAAKRSEKPVEQPAREPYGAILPQPGLCVYLGAPVEVDELANIQSSLQYAIIDLVEIWEAIEDMFEESAAINAMRLGEDLDVEDLEASASEEICRARNAGRARIHKTMANLRFADKQLSEQQHRLGIARMRADEVKAPVVAINIVGTQRERDIEGTEAKALLAAAGGAS